MTMKKMMERRFGKKRGKRVFPEGMVNGKNQPDNENISHIRSNAFDSKCYDVKLMFRSFALSTLND